MCTDAQEYRVSGARNKPDHLPSYRTSIYNRDSRTHRHDPHKTWFPSVLKAKQITWLLIFIN